jgi:hypothetical protein
MGTESRSIPPLLVNEQPLLLLLDTEFPVSFLRYLSRQYVE